MTLCQLIAVGAAVVNPLSYKVFDQLTAGRHIEAEHHSRAAEGRLVTSASSASSSELVWESPSVVCLVCPFSLFLLI